MTRVPTAGALGRCLAAACVVVGGFACSTESGSGPEVESWFGFGVPVMGISADERTGEPITLHEPLSAHTEVPMVRGGQGSMMLPLSIRAAGFEIPGMDDQLAWPTLDVRAEVEGTTGPDGRPFFEIIDYPVWFEPDGDQWSFPYFGMVVRDDLDDLDALVGRAGRLSATLWPADAEPLTTTAEFVVGPVPGDGSGP